MTFASNAVLNGLTGYNMNDQLNQYVHCHLLRIVDKLTINMFHSKAKSKKQGLKGQQPIHAYCNRSVRYSLTFCFLTTSGQK